MGRVAACWLRHRLLGHWHVCRGPLGSALASHQAQAHNRGAVLGSYQVGTSLARVLAPFVSGPVFQRFGPGAPFLLGAVVTLQASWCMRAIRPSTNSTDSQA
jgi:MFS family permease